MSREGRALGPEGRAQEVGSEKTAGRVALAVGALVLVGMAVIGLWASRRCPPGRVDLGLYGGPDQLTYLMFMREAAAGRPAYDLMTTRPTPPVPLFQFCRVIGRLVPLTGLSAVQMYNIAQALAAALYLLVLWKALRRWLPDPTHRVLAFVATAGGSGLGWVIVLFPQLHRYIWPVEGWFSELWSFSSVLLFLHFGLALLMLALILWALGDLWVTRTGRWVVPWATMSAAGVCLAEVHPFTFLPMAGAVLVYAVLLAGFSGISRRARVVALAALLPGAAAMAHLAWESGRNPIMKAWAAQNTLRSPSPRSFVEGFGLVGIMAVLVVAAWGWWWLRRRARGDAPVLAGALRVMRSMPRPTVPFALSWVLVAMSLAYSYPLILFARRCVEGMHIFLVLLAVPLMAALLRPVTARFGLWGTAFVAALVLWPGNLVVAGTAVSARRIRATVDEVQSWRAIDADLPSQAALFCCAHDGAYVAAMTGHRVWVGHPQATPDYDQNERIARLFMSPRANNRFRAEVLRHSRCDYVLAEKVGPAVLHALRSLLGAPVVTCGTVDIFRIPKALRSPRSAPRAPAGMERVAPKRASGSRGRAYPRPAIRSG